MVKIEQNKIIIEIETSHPADDLQELQKEIINVIREYDYAAYRNNNGCPFYCILYLLEATLPEYEFYKKMLENKN